MGIIINKDTRIAVQGITGKEGSKATYEMLKYGSNVVCGVTPNKGGEEIYGVKVFNSILEAKAEVGEIDISVIYVPPFRVKGAFLEAVENGIKKVLVVTENVPLHDIAYMIELSRRENVLFVGPSSVGIITPGESKVGSIGGLECFQFVKGDIGVISKSGGLTSETAMLLKTNGYGVSSAVGIGGDIISGSDFVDILNLFEKDNLTRAIIVIGEVGGEYEHLIAEAFSCGKLSKPSIVFIAGKHTEGFEDTSLGHAGAIIEGERTTWQSKAKALNNSGVLFCEAYDEIIEKLKSIK